MSVENLLGYRMQIIIEESGELLRGRLHLIILLLWGRLLWIIILLNRRCSIILCYGSIAVVLLEIVFVIG